MEKYRATRSCALIAPLQCIPSPVAITPSCPHQYNLLLLFWACFCCNGTRYVTSPYTCVAITRNQWYVPCTGP